MFPQGGNETDLSNFTFQSSLQNTETRYFVLWLSLTVKTDDVTKGRKVVDPHGRFRGEWVKVKIDRVKLLMIFIFLKISVKSK